MLSDNRSSLLLAVTLRALAVICVPLPILASSSLTSLPLPNLTLDSIAVMATPANAPPPARLRAWLLAMDLISISPVDVNVVPSTKALTVVSILASAKLTVNAPIAEAETATVSVFSILAIDSAWTVVLTELIFVVFVVSALPFVLAWMVLCILFLTTLTPKAPPILADNATATALLER